jgi:hypothetical protein
VLDKNTVKVVAAEYDLLVVDKEEQGVTAGAVKQRDFMELEDLDAAVSDCHNTAVLTSNWQGSKHRFVTCCLWQGGLASVRAPSSDVT